jgi:hypothetical protein
MLKHLLNAFTPEKGIELNNLTFSRQEFCPKLDYNTEIQNKNKFLSFFCAMAAFWPDMC